jgi:hypothetical protein
VEHLLGLIAILMICMLFRRPYEIHIHYHGEQPVRPKFLDNVGRKPERIKRIFMRDVVKKILADSGDQEMTSIAIAKVIEEQSLWNARISGKDLLDAVMNALRYLKRHGEVVEREQS